MGVESNYQAAGGVPKMSFGGALAMTSLFSGLSGAYGDYLQSKNQKDIANANARADEMRARDAIKRGHELEARSRQGTKKLRGTQRAALAAQGVDVNVGSAQDIQTETEVIGELDALTIKNNALREAYGYSTQARGTALQGTLTAGATRQQGFQTLLASGVQSYGYWKGLR